MATTTANYNLIKPTMAESADIRTINGNMDTIDDIMHASQVSLADAYDSTETYNKDDVVMYQYLMYKCKEDNVTGSWDATKWERTTAGESGSGGTEVEANPSGTPSADLAKLGINGIIYGIPSGDEVEANPSGIGNTDLTKLGINGTVYNIPSGGGGSGDVSLTSETLWTNTNGSGNGTYTLLKSIDEFDFISVRFGLWSDYISGNLCENRILAVKDLQSLHTDNKVTIFSGFASRTIYTDWNGNTLICSHSEGSQIILQVDGIKIVGSGGGKDGGYSSTLLWDYVTDNAGTIPYGTYSVTLNDAIENYDILIGEIKSISEDSGVWDNTSQMFIDINTLINSNNPNRYLYTSYDNRGSGWYISGTTMEKVAEGGGNNSNGLVRVYGLKFGGGSGEGYSETSLWSGSDSATMQLSESFENYDAIMIIATASTQQGNYRLTNIWSVDYLKNHINDGVRFGLTGDAWYIYFSITDSTTFTRQDQNITYISEIKGLKFGEGGSSEGINYSTEEQDTGIKWIDGKTIYQKTFSFSDGDYQLQRNSWTAISSVSIPTLENVVDIRMIGYDTANKYPAVEDGCSKRFVNGVLNYYLDKDFPIYLRAVTVRYTKA